MPISVTQRTRVIDPSPWSGENPLLDIGFMRCKSTAITSGFALHRAVLEHRDHVASFFLRVCESILPSS
jgi:hypothetical protein